jgi:starch synthase
MPKSKKLKILLVSSEMAPFAKTGGLADVTAALALHLHQHGHEVRVVLPKYGSLRYQLRFEQKNSLCVTMGQGEEWCSVEQTTTAQGVAVVLIDHEHYFGRKELYHDEQMNDYLDNPRRFGFFSRAALQYCLDYDFRPDVVHANDWQTALVPAYLKMWFWNSPILGSAASVLTIHNIAYQGVYPAQHRGYLGLNDSAFAPNRFEDFGRINLLKGGIAFADVVNTVSPGHAREITTPYGGFGLAPFLADKGARFSGILNGVDYNEWSPETDTHIAQNYSVNALQGKAVCKAALQKAFGLEQDPAVCLIGTVGRFVQQKGYELVRTIIERVLQQMHVQFVILGSGEHDLQRYFGDLPARFGAKAGSYIGFNHELSHLVEAGSDFFLMPSLFEPCGLNQMYSLRYGTLPIVRATGGLDDTVEQYDEHSGAGTGFKFWDAHPEALYYTIGWSVSTWYDRHHHIDKMRTRAMQQDFSWARAIKAYEVLYHDAVAAKHEYDRIHGL